MKTDDTRNAEIDDVDVLLSYVDIVAHAVNAAEIIRRLRQDHALSSETIRRALDDRMTERKCDRQFLIHGLEPVLAAAQGIGALCSDCDHPEHEGACEDQGEYPTPTEAAIRKELACAASSNLLPNQAPAVACSLVLRGMNTALMGSLSETVDGGLRLMSPNGQPGQARGGKIPMVEQFFDYADVLVFAVERMVQIESSPIVLPRS